MAALAAAGRRGPGRRPARPGRAAAGAPVLVACSGGADSLALAAATAFVAPRLGLRAGLVTVDHGLQAGSAERAAAVAAWARGAGLRPGRGGAGRGGRAARRAGGGRPRRPLRGAGRRRPRRHGAAAVLLGHTRDDQAETVLLALARGAGPRGLAGCRSARRGGVRCCGRCSTSRRADTRKACAALGLTAWDDPHNADPAYARSRVRGDALPALVDALGPAVVDNLARTAALLAADIDALDALAAAALAAAP